MTSIWLNFTFICWSFVGFTGFEVGSLLRWILGTTRGFLRKGQWDKRIRKELKGICKLLTSLGFFLTVLI